MDKKELIIAVWIKKAEHDLGMAKLAIEYQPDFRDFICFHCQQAAKKYLKAYLVYLDIIFKKTHSLDYLLDLISERETVSD
jgi:HEPN domain-containing protein